MGAYKSLVKDETKEKARKAIELKNQGKSATEIAVTLSLSKSRVYELLKEHNWYSKG